jgi:hypothetical protein
MFMLQSLTNSSADLGTLFLMALPTLIILAVVVGKLLANRKRRLALRSAAERQICT